MKQLTRVQFFKLAGKVATNSQPFRVNAEWGYNGNHWWSISAVNEDASKITHLNSCSDNAIHNLKLAAKNGVVPGEEIN